jgi:hypothetical protein
MPQPAQPMLDVIYENWKNYDRKLRDRIAPLTPENLTLQPAPYPRS